MIQLNLLPDLKKEFIKAQKAKAFVTSLSILVTLGALSLSGLLFVYVTFVQRYQIESATATIGQQLQQLKDITDIDKYLTIQNQLTSLPALHDNKGEYSRLFTFLGVLNPNAPNSVSLSTAQLITADQTLLLTGTTATFETLNIFVDTLKNAEITYLPVGQNEAATERMFSQVLIQASGLVRSKNHGLISFTVKATYGNALFAVTNTQMEAKVPNITTTPSVTQSPHPVFDNKESQ